VRPAGIAGVLLALAAAPDAARAQSSTYEQLQVFSGLLNQIRVNYVDSVTAERLVRGAITGMLSALDPHSYFLSRADAERTYGYTGGRLGSVGIVVDDADDAVVVQSVERRSPADRAGVLPGDRVIALGDSVTAGLRAPTVQARLYGERGRRIRVRLERGPRFDPDTVSVNLRYDRIESRSVSLARNLELGIGYVRVTEFGERAMREVREAASRVVSGPRENHVLILDLRGNPGGLVREAHGMAELFLRRGQPIFSTRGRRRDMDSSYAARRDGEFADLPLIILVDERSASASEALAGALQDNDRALIMGRRTFGKALMQLPFHVAPHNDVVMLTVGYVLLPSGRLIQRPYRNMTPAQYRAMAGRPPGDSAATDTFRTRAGRPVQAGGGVVPDTILPSPGSLPVWFTAAADTGLVLAVTDSVAQSLASDATTQSRWFNTPALWQSALVEPLLERVRARLGVAARPDSAVAARLGRILADRVVEVRWGTEAEEEFRILHDPDIVAARVIARVAPPVVRRN
jgi:carboxyl-terminal processing protease